MYLRVVSIGVLPPGSPMEPLPGERAFLDMSYVAFRVPNKESLPPGFTELA